MGEPLWKIEGFVATAAGNPRVQEWFDDEISETDRNALKRPDAVPCGRSSGLYGKSRISSGSVRLGIGEVKVRVPTGAMRVYGDLPDDTNRFVFLCGVIKKKTKDRDGIDTALLRLKSLKKGEGKTYEFDFSERDAAQDSGRGKQREPRWWKRAYLKRLLFKSVRHVMPESK